MKQLAFGLGYSDHRKLINLINRNRGEFEGKTLVLKLSTSELRSPGDLIINYHGVIRAAMLSDAPNAVRFIV